MKKIVEPEIHAVFIHTADLIRSAQWYCDLLGLDFNPEMVSKPVFNVPVNGSTYLTIDSHAFDPDFNFRPSTGPVFTVFSGDLQAVRQWVAETDISVVREIEKDRSFGWFHIHDPDHNIVMVCGDC